MVIFSHNPTESVDIKGGLPVKEPLCDLLHLPKHVASKPGPKFCKWAYFLFQKLSTKTK